MLNVLEFKELELVTEILTSFDDDDTIIKIENKRVVFSYLSKRNKEPMIEKAERIRDFLRENNNSLKLLTSEGVFYFQEKGFILKKPKSKNKVKIEKGQIDIKVTYEESSQEIYIDIQFIIDKIEQEESSDNIYKMTYNHAKNLNNQKAHKVNKSSKGKGM